MGSVFILVFYFCLAGIGVLSLWLLHWFHGVSGLFRFHSIH